MEKKKPWKWLIIIAAIAAVAVLVIVLAISNSPSKRVAKLLDIGQKYLEDGKYEEAIAAYEEALDIDEKCVKAYLGEADAYVALGEYEQAIAVYEEALEIDQKSEKAYLGEADAYVALGEYEKAIISYEKALDIKPKKVKAYLGEADAYVALGDYENAIAALEKGYELTGKEQLMDQLENIREESKKTEEQENPVDKEAEAVKAEDSVGTFNQELLLEPYPLNAKTFSGFTDHGDYFSVETNIEEFLCLPRNTYDAMQMGETVDINGAMYTMVPDPDPDGVDVKMLKAPDGGLFVPATESMVDLYGTSINGCNIESLDILLKVGSDDYVGGTWVENPTIMPGYTLNIRKDAEILNYDPNTSNVFQSAPVSAVSVFQSGQATPGGYILVFDENGLVKQLMEIFES